MDPESHEASRWHPMTKSLGQLFMNFIWHFQLEQTANHSRDAHQNFWHLRSSATKIWLIALSFQDQPQHINRNRWNIVHNIHILSIFIIFSWDLPEKSENLRQPARQPIRSEARVLQRCSPRWSWGPDQSTWWRDRRHLCRPPPEATRSLASLGWEKWRGCMWLTTNTSQNYSLMSLRSKLSDLYKHAKCPCFNLILQFRASRSTLFWLSKMPIRCQ